MPGWAVSCRAAQRAGFSVGGWTVHHGGTKMQRTCFDALSYHLSQNSRGMCRTYWNEKRSTANEEKVRPADLHRRAAAKATPHGGPLLTVSSSPARQQLGVGTGVALNCEGNVIDSLREEPQFFEIKVVRCTCPVLVAFDSKQRPESCNSSQKGCTAAPRHPHQVVARLVAEVAQAPLFA